ncbi:MAG: hypothetical protein II706_05145, partial [Bacteroidaceae bacterium]|nr:hypothetical protein [Bacteroidaceae bacterium]
MFCYQENTHFSQATECSREKFWEAIKSPSTRWRIDTRRAILTAVKQDDGVAVKRLMELTDFKKFMLKKERMKEGARKKFMAKSSGEKLLAFAQELKENLTAFIFSCREFDATPTQKNKEVMFRHRRLKDCHLNGLVMLDIDHVENPLEVFEKLKANQELMDRTGFVHVTSSKQGIRIVFTANLKDGNLADNQIVFAQKLGYKPDGSCIDGTRNSFAPKEEDVLYVNEDLLFGHYDEAFDKKFTPMYRNEETQPLYHQFEEEGSEKLKVNSEKSKSPNSQLSTLNCQLTWRGMDVQAIIDQRFAEKLPCAEDSNRHKESLKLASDLLILFDGDKQKVYDTLMRQPWVQEIVEERDENVEQTVESAFERMRKREKEYLTQMPSPAMQEAILTVAGKTYKELTEVSEQGKVESEKSGSPNCQLSTINSQLEKWGEEIEALFPMFPILKDICKGLKRNQYPAAVFVGGGLLMTLMTRCTYRFYHRPEELRRLNNSTLIIGDPASGKSFATRLYKLLTGPIVTSDMEGKKAINAYREEMRTKGANKEKPKKPKVVVRIHPARTSNAQFIQDMVNAVEVVDGTEMQLHMLTFDTELDNTLTVQKGGSWI